MDGKRWENKKWTLGVVTEQPEASLNLRVKISKFAKFGGLVTGVYGVYGKYVEKRNGQLSNTEYVADQISNGIGFVPFYGTIWSIGYSLGEDFGPSKWFGDNDNKWFE